MGKIRRNLVLLLLGLAACGCNVRVKSVLNRAEKLMTERPDSALSLIRTIDRKKIAGEAMLARYALCYSQALDKSFIDLKSDSLIRIASDYYMRHGTLEERTKALFYLGRVYENAGEMEKSADRFIQAEVLSRELETKDPYLRGLICYSTAICFYHQGGMDGALKFFEKSEQAYIRAGLETHAGNCFWAQAGIYLANEEYENAVKYFDKAIEYYENGHAPEEKIAAVKRWKQGLETASDTTKDVRTKIGLFRGYCSGDFSKKSICEWGWLASLYAEMPNIDSARYYEEQVLKYADRPEYKVWAHLGLSKVEEAAGDYSGALSHYKRGLAIRDSLDNVRHISLARNMNSRIQAEQLQSEYYALQSRHRLQATIGGLILLIALLLGWLLIRAGRVWRRRLIEQQKADAESREQVTQKLNAAYSELQCQYDDLLKKVNDPVEDEREICFYETLEKRFIGLKHLVDNAYLYKTKPAAFFKAFSDFATVSPSAKKEVWADLHFIVNKKFGGLIDHLRANYSGLSPHDLDLCCLICFGFLPTGICFLYGYEDMGSLYNKRSRLRQKLNLPEGQNLDEYLVALSDELMQEKPVKKKKPRGKKQFPATG